jgi:hypothetical protein
MQHAHQQQLPQQQHNYSHSYDDDGGDRGDEKKRVKWSAEEDGKLRQAVQMHAGKNWKKIAQSAFNSEKTDVQCLHR